MKKFDFTPFGLTSALSSLNTWIKFEEKKWCIQLLGIIMPGAVVLNFSI